MSDRVEDLRVLRDGLVARMETCQSDQNYAVMGRLLKDVVKELDELAGAGGAGASVSALSEFERRLRERTEAEAARRAAP